MAQAAAASDDFHGPALALCVRCRPPLAHRAVSEPVGRDASTGWRGGKRFCSTVFLRTRVFGLRVWASLG